MAFWCLQFTQKTNEINSTWGTIVVKSNFFVHSLGELKIPKRHFEINWPLALSISYKIVSCHWILRMTILFLFQLVHFCPLFWFSNDFFPEPWCETKVQRWDLLKSRTSVFFTLYDRKGQKVSKNNIFAFNSSKKRTKDV